MIKNKLPKSYEQECSFATKEKRKGRSKGEIIVGKRKKWGVTSKMIVEEDLVLTEIEERKEIFVIISVYNRKEWKETEERINRMVEEKVLNYMIIGEDLKQESQGEQYQRKEVKKERVKIKRQIIREIG